jgi:hypothetical protein
MPSGTQPSDAVKSKQQDGGPDGPGNSHPLGRLPAALESLVTGVRDCKVVLVGSRYYIADGPPASTAR